jgi:hypothetical protein
MVEMTQTDQGSGFPSPAAAVSGLVLLVFLPLFLLHTSHYLYYFTDDEAIPLIYAQRLLAGHGLSYNSIEGRVEGYSDFLQVLLGAAALTFVRALGWSRLSVFFVLAGLSLVWATLALWWFVRTLSAQPHVTPAGLVAASGFLALAPPLAAWSGSSSEMSLVLLLVTICCAALVRQSTAMRALAAAAILLLLLRIDGGIYALALIGPWLAFGPRRRELMWRVGVPFACAAFAYHGARLWYFGELLTAPIHTKVLHRLVLAHNAVVKAPEVPYGLAFFTMYGLLPATAGMGTLVAACRRHRTALLLLCSVVMLMTYAAIVGDWMFGFRFFIPALPPLAGALAFGVSRVRDRRLSYAIVGILLAWFGWTAIGQARVYEAIPHRESWLRSPSFDSSRYFGPYYGLWKALEPYVKPGDRIAYNQAGFVPFMLDADNVDDLGICSKFVAKLPTTDVVFTGVGRYSPLTNAHALRSAHAYVLYHHPKYVIAPVRDLRMANANHIPAHILRSQYRLLFVAHGTDAVYQRRSPDPAPIGATDFLENLAHPSRLRGALIDDRAASPERFLERFSMLTDGVTRFGFDRRTSIRLILSAEDVPVSEVDIARVFSSADALLEITASSSSGERLFAASVPLERGRGRAVTFGFPSPLRAAEIRLDFEHPDGRRGSVWLTDLRVQGQTPELAEYVRQLGFTDASRDR